MEDISFSDIAIVSCCTLNLELSYLKKEGFIDAEKIYYTKPGLHQNCHELERQLIQQINMARKKVDKVIVIYGGKFCYVNMDEPTRTMQKIIQEQGPGVGRVQATHCMDMIAGETEREQIARELVGDEKVWWMTPGWIEYRRQVFEGWDKGLANENFPKHTGGAIVLDGIGYVDKYMAEKPEDFLEYSDWMGIPIQGYSVTLDRFKSLLSEQARILLER